MGAGHAAGQAAASLRQEKYEGEIIGLMARYQDIFGELGQT